MSYKFRWAALWFICLIAGIGYAQESRQEPTISEILNTLLLRQSLVKSIRYTWTQKVTYPKNSLHVEGADFTQIGKGPSADTTIERTVTVIIEDGKLRMDIRSMLWHVMEARFVPDEKTARYGIEGKSKIYHSTIANGVIDQRDESTRDFATAELAPILSAYRLLDPSLGLAKPDEVRLAGYGQYQGRRCIVMERVFEEHNDTLTYRWMLAEDVGYLPIRFVSISGADRVLLDVSMSYEPDEQIGWRLTSWNSVYPKTSTLAHDAKPTEISFNPPLAPEAFVLTFPIGTRVNDRIAGTEYTVEADAGQLPPQ